MRIDGRIALVASGVVLLAAMPAQAAGLLWVPHNSPAAKANVVMGGEERGRPLPICRGEYNKGIHPGKVVAGKCNIGWGGKEIVLTKFEVLTGPAKAVRWVKTTTGAKLPPATFVGGREPGRLLPVCRAVYQQAVHPGKIVAGKCNIGWGGKEIVLTSYEAMALTPAALGEVAKPGHGLPVKGDAAAEELKALMAALHAEKASGKDEALKQQALGLHQKQQRMKHLSEALKALKTGKGHDAKKIAEAVGVKLAGKPGPDMKEIEAQLANLRQETESDMSKMQSLVDQRNQQFELVSNLLKKFHEMQKSIIRNMR